MHAIFLRSVDQGRSWGGRDASQTQLLGGEFALKTLSNGTVLLIDGGGAIYRSTDAGARSFTLAHKFDCGEMGWTVLEQRPPAGWNGVGVYDIRVFTSCGPAKASIWRSTSSGLTWSSHKNVSADLGWVTRVTPDCRPSEGRAEKNRTYGLSVTVFYFSRFPPLG
jgi:hypothetical protein